MSDSNLWNSFFNGSDFVSDYIILACPHNVPLDIIFLLDTRNLILKHFLKHERKWTFTNIRQWSRIILLEVIAVFVYPVKLSKRGFQFLSRRNRAMADSTKVNVSLSTSKIIWKVTNFQHLDLHKWNDWLFQLDHCWNYLRTTQQELQHFNFLQKAKIFSKFLITFFENDRFWGSRRFLGVVHLKKGIMNSSW